MGIVIADRGENVSDAWPLRSVRTRSPGRSFFLGLYGRTEKRATLACPRYSVILPV
jgi:hypothetical protein